MEPSKEFWVFLAKESIRGGTSVASLDCEVVEDAEHTTARKSSNSGCVGRSPNNPKSPAFAVTDSTWGNAHW